MGRNMRHHSAHFNGQSGIVANKNTKFVLHHFNYCVEKLNLTEIHFISLELKPNKVETEWINMTFN